MMRVLVIFALFLTTVFATQTSYSGYKVYQITPKNVREMTILKAFEQDPQFDFWTVLRTINMPVDIMVSPKYQKIFSTVLNMNGIEHRIMIEDVESKLNIERIEQALAPKTQHGKMDFNKYYRYGEIQDYLELIAWAVEDATVESIGKSYEGRDIDMIKICNKACGDKPAILVDCGIHAREWIAPATCLHIIDEVLQNGKNSTLYNDVDWYIIPSLNPDGYEYSHTTTRLWRKTRTPGKICDGVDPNRNFDYHWMETGASNNECSETYAGPNAFSELETQALRDLVLAHKESGNIKLYLTIHSYGQYLLYPWGWTSALPEDAPELHAVAVDAEAAIRAVAGTRYTIGSSTNVLYAAAGGSDDWVKAIGGVELSYTIELPGPSFVVPVSRIEPIVKETFEGIRSYHKYIVEKFARK